jgi:hypothetical protein
MAWPPFFDEIWQGPRSTCESALEVATADEKQPSLDADGEESAALELSYGCCSGPFACMDNQSDLHVRKVVHFSFSRPATSDVGGREIEIGIG